MRGTSTSQPNSGLVSNHDSVSRRDTVDPTTASTGKRPSAIVAPASARVVTTVRCSVLVPRSVTATGVCRVPAGGDERLEGLRGPVGLAEDDDGDPGVDGARQVDAACPRGDDVHARWRLLEVSGTPAYDGTAVTELTPGTTSKAMPARRRPRPPRRGR